MDIAELIKGSVMNDYGLELQQKEILAKYNNEIILIDQRERLL